MSLAADTRGVHVTLTRPPVFRPRRGAAPVDVFSRDADEAAALLRGMLGRCAASRALVTVSVHLEWAQPPCTPQRLIDRLCRSDETITALARGHRTLTGQDTGAVRPLLLPCAAPDEQDTARAPTVPEAQHGNPWTLLSMAGEDVAAQALCSVLSWPAEWQASARVIVAHWSGAGDGRG